MRPEDHPRPNLRRDRFISLDGRWEFAHDDEDRGLAERWFERTEPFPREIVVPFPPESKASGLDESGFHPVVWYRREIELDETDRQGRLMIHFGAVDYEASVWVNGRMAVHHKGGHTPFCADIAPLLVSGATHVITVRAEDMPRDLQQPRGKQFWEEKPGYIWYHRTTGIWQPVWLEPLPLIFIEELRWTPDVDRFGVAMIARLNAAPQTGWSIRVRLCGESPVEVLAEDLYLLCSREIRRDLLLDISDAAIRRRRQLLWGPDHPNLIDATVELLDASGSVIDHVESYFGLRRIELRGGRFILNGIPTFLRLVLAQNYWPDSHLTAPSPDALRQEVELTKSLGFNGLRIHQKIEDPRFLYWCDRYGMLVWGEMANAYVFSDSAVQMLVSEWMDAVRRDYNHPCIVTWVPLNESWGVPDLDRSAQQRHYVRALFHLTHALDPTRPVIANDGWQHAVGDIFGVHDYAPSGDVLYERYGDRAKVIQTFREVRPHHHPLLGEGGTLGDEPIVISEFGGIAFKPAHEEDWFGYGQFSGPEELLSAYESLVNGLLESTVLAGFCYTQLTDTEQETNGLLTIDRKPKLDPERLRQINTRPAKSVPSEVLDALIKQEVDKRRRDRAAPKTE
ncbi:glycoside hydrolase family 2 [Pseudaminobacter sp. 19-2017]|uniref:Glycoside hydrolase family 2 n=1 Tax=Pseudaminobacter soli (ex Zhang et al. 2022) TaxID=2831468 RepID=A0A942E201_9HYPH|nr:sugar-binding domain-containing protein [Pseudaminobacter soli]MBS3652319.1 glycoside hydrolase family 2 [Pseudaminobacter soli]